MNARSKKTSQKTHMKRRTLERFGMALNRRDLDEMTSMIQAGRSEFIDRRSNRTARHRVEFNGVSMDVIYDNARKTVVTALFADEAIRQEIEGIEAE
jgi:hypothetical protein